MGFDEDLKLVKRAMQSADCDNSAVRAWMKLFDKVKRQTILTEQTYARARDSVQEIQTNAKQLEQMIITTENWKSEDLDTLRVIAKKLLKLQGTYEHEFLVSPQNQEYHLTYHTIIDLCNKFNGEVENKLIFQSEIENLLSLNHEVLEHVIPAFAHLGFYEVNRSTEDLSDLPYQEKMRKITSLYLSDFIRPMKKQMVLATEYADRMKANGSLDSGWKSSRLQDTFAILLNRDGENQSAEARAEAFLGRIEKEL